MIEKHSNTMDYVDGKMDHYNPTRKRKLLTVFDDTIVVNLKNKKIQAIIKELFIRCRKLNISLVFISQSYFSVPKILQIKFITLFDDENCNRRELKNIPIYRSADIDYNDFMKIYRECTKEPHSFLRSVTTLPTSDPLRI